MTHPLTIADAAAALRAKQITSVELTETALDRIGELNDSVGAFLFVNTEKALEMARRADEDFAAGIDRGSLQGIPLGLKDILATEDAPTTAGSLVLDRNWGQGHDSVVAERLRAAGAILMGKLSTWEFATGQPAPDSTFPIPRNPWDLSRSPGGSSSGTGAAVASHMVFGGLGTDTGGSVRNPSAKNGITGLKPTFGLVPKWGCVPAGYSLDAIGPMARSALDCALMLNVIAGHDPRDATASSAPVDDYARDIEDGVKGLKVGVPTEYFYDHPKLEPEVKDATLGVVEMLRTLGAEIFEVKLPLAELASIANSVTGGCEGFAYHRIDIGSPKWNDYGPQTRMKIARGALYTGADYVQAQRFRSWFCREAAKVMAEVDVLVAPVTYEVSLLMEDADKGVYSDTSPRSPFNLLGYPALAVPSGFASNGMPLSSQIVGAPFADATVLRAAHALQQATDWHTKVPPMVAASAVGS